MRTRDVTSTTLSIKYMKTCNICIIHFTNKQKLQSRDVTRIKCIVWAMRFPVLICFPTPQTL